MPQTKVNNAESHESIKRIHSDEQSTSTTKRVKSSASKTNDNIDPSSPQLSSKQKTISDLPEEVLQGILEFAVGKSKRRRFLNASLVCQLWNRLISKSKWIMDNLKPKITLKLSSNKQNHENFQITRNYRELELEDYDNSDQCSSCRSYGDSEDNEDDLPILPWLILTKISQFSISQHLRKIVLNYVKISPQYMNALTMFENLDGLSLLKCYTDEFTIIEPIELTKIKHLELDLQNENDDAMNIILPWLKPCKNMKSVKIISREDVVSLSVINFFNQIGSLDELSLDWLYPRHHDVLIELKPKFMWKKLELRLKSYNRDRKARFINITKAIDSVKALCQASSENAEAFISFSIDSLENDDYASCVLAVLNTCKKIKTLTMTTKHKHTAKTSKSFDSLRMMGEVEHLVLDLAFKTQRYAMDPVIIKIITNLPNIKKISLKDKTWSCSDDSDLVQVFTVMKNLNHLDLYSLNMFYVGDLRLDILQFENLQTFSFGLKLFNDHDQSYKYDCTEDLWKICAVNPTLNHLNIKLYGYPCWSIISFEGKVTKMSLMRIYDEWLAAKSSVKTCRFIIEEKFIAPAKTQDEKEFKLFGRILSEAERFFFIDIQVI